MAAKTYRKTALVTAEQFRPEVGQIPKGVFAGDLGDPKSHPLSQWVLDTKEGRHTLRGGDYICTGPAGEQWNVAKEIFEATYEEVSSIPPADQHAPSIDMASPRMVDAVKSVFFLAADEENELLASLITKAIGDKPYCWEAITGTAGAGEGCNAFFHMKQLAVEYVQRHGGYIKPLYAAHVTPPGDLREENERLRQRVKALEEALEPFSVFAGVVFERNFNASDPVDTMTASDGGQAALLAGDFFRARAALKGDA